VLARSTGVSISKGGSEPAREEAGISTKKSGSILRSIIAQNPLYPIESEHPPPAPFAPQNQ
ncbi:hypothetical protein QIW46_29255, partial [Pseudomonas fluorescens]|uniref:hypothetical protein n=1 Tax=Pseudomonas fluorescens TaxID=294 RepID=UPI0035231224